MATTKPITIFEKKSIIDWFVIIPFFVNIIIIYISKYYNFHFNIIYQLFANLVSIATMYILRANKECKSVKEEEKDEKNLGVEEKAERSVGRFVNLFKVFIITIVTLLLTYPMMLGYYFFFKKVENPYAKSIIWSIYYTLFYMLINIIVNYRWFGTKALFCPHSSSDNGWKIYKILGTTFIVINILVLCGCLTD